jgi:hypothetical protein
VACESRIRAPPRLSALGLINAKAGRLLGTVQQALGQLVEWGNLQSQPDMARVTTIEDYSASGTDQFSGNATLTEASTADFSM